MKPNMSIAAVAILAAAMPFAAAQAQLLRAAEAQVTETDDPALIVARPDATLGFDEVDARMLQIPASKRAGFINDPERIEQLLQNLLLMRQLAAAARESGVDQNPLTQQEIALAAEEILAKRYLAAEQAKVEPPDFTIVAEERYAANPSAFDTPVMIDVRHLLVKRETHGDAAAKQRAEALRAEFFAGDSSFEEFVKQYSEEPRAEMHGGMLASLTRGKAAGAFEDAAFALKQPGDLSAVVATQFGYHIIRLEKRVESQRRSFDEVKEAILAELESDYASQARDKLIERLKSKPMTVNPDNVLALRTRYLPGAEGEVRLRSVEGRSADEAPGEGAPPPQ